MTKPVITVLVLALSLAGCSKAPGPAAADRGVAEAGRLTNPPRFLNEREPLGAVPADATSVVFSSDRRMVAYSFGQKATMEVFAGRVGEEARRMGEIPALGRTFQWQGDGTALIYVQRLYKEVPGEFADWGLPKTVTLGYRVTRLPLDGTATQVLADSTETVPGATTALPAPLTWLANPKTDQVAFMASSGAGHTGALWLVASDGAPPVKLDEDEVYGDLAWSPDGTLLAYSAAPQDGKAALEVKVFDLASREIRTAVTAAGDPFLAWTADSEVLQILKADGDGAVTPSLDVARYAVRTGETTRDSINLREPGTGRTHEYSAFIPSPDGTRLLGFRGRIGLLDGRLSKVSETVVVSLTRRNVTVLGEPVGLVGWLNDARVMYVEGTGRTPGIFTASAPPALLEESNGLP